MTSSFCGGFVPTGTMQMAKRHISFLLCGSITTRVGPISGRAGRQHDFAFSRTPVMDCRDEPSCTHLEGVGGDCRDPGIRLSIRWLLFLWLVPFPRTFRCSCLSLTLTLRFSGFIRPPASQWQLWCRSRELGISCSRGGYTSTDVSVDPGHQEWSQLASLTRSLAFVLCFRITWPLEKVMSKGGRRTRAVRHRLSQAPHRAHTTGGGQLSGQQPAVLTFFGRVIPLSARLSRDESCSSSCPEWRDPIAEKEPSFGLPTVWTRRYR